MNKVSVTAWCKLVCNLRIILKRVMGTNILVMTVKCLTTKVVLEPDPQGSGSETTLQKWHSIKALLMIFSPSPSGR